jgi:ergothioneine biosynthesis protein EgtC
MCRFVVYKGSPITLDLLTTRPAHSIIRQSYKSRLMREPLNGDGFGLAWYVPELSPQPAQYRSIQPAWNNVNLLHLARVSRSPMILAHVRAATPGLGISESNCHPFADERFAFMHNGAISEFFKVKRKLQEGLTDHSFQWIHGTTDSELAFAVFRDFHTSLKNPDETQRIADALAATIRKIVETSRVMNCEGGCRLNLVVSDGERVVASRYTTADTDPPSLYYRTGDRYVCENGNCRMLDASGQPSALIVASEPLSEDDEDWIPIPRNHLILIDVDFSIRLQAID